MKDSRISDKIDRVILFGSVARGDFSNDSDIDLFIESGLGQKEVLKKLAVFHKSTAAKNSKLKGINNEFSIIVGAMKDFQGLHESIEDSGIILYGRYEPSTTGDHFTLFRISAEGNTAEKVRLWRRLYGYQQKVGEKAYKSKGLIDEYMAHKIANGVLIVPFKHRQKLIDFFNKNKISFSMYDLHSREF